MVKQYTIKALRSLTLNKDRRILILLKYQENETRSLLGENEVNKMVFNKYVKIRQLGHEENEDIFKNPKDDIIMEEKIDGANFRFMLSKGNIIFGSRTQELDDENIEKNWSYCVKYIKVCHALGSPSLLGAEC